MTATVLTTRDRLAPVRGALLERARDEVDAVVGRAESDAATTLGRARLEADELRARARSEGEADAQDVLASARTRARRRARATVLAAQRELYDDLRQQVHRAAQELRDEPGYATLRRRLEEQAREVLGPDAQVSEPAEGGVVARAGTRRFACTLPALADAALAAVDVEGLWSP